MYRQNPSPAENRALYRRIIGLTAILFLAVATLAPDVLAGNWPQWRGPTNTGVSDEHDLPAAWGEDANIAWKLPMPAPAGSTPAVWGDRIFLTSEDGRDTVLLCVSTAGKERWRRPLGTHNGQKYMSGEGNNSSPSPTTDGKHVWTFDGAGHLACFTADGEEVWKLDAQERYGRFRLQFGMHSTPVVDGDRVYLALLHSGAWVVAALDKQTGKEIWKHERQSDATDENEHAYTSPFVWRRGNDALLIVHGNDYCTAHDLDTGKVVWRVGGLNPAENYNRALRFVASPAISRDLIVIPTAKRGPVVGVRPDSKGRIEKGGAGEVWRMPRNTPDVSSPVIYDGLVYLCGERGMLYVVDAATGHEVYPPRQLHKALYRASPVAGDGKVYLLARDATCTVIKAGRTFEMLAENRLPDDTSASIAISGGRLYLRGWKHLWAVGK